MATMTAIEQSRPKAGVVGAGIAGLAAAIALRKAGWDVEVFERAHMKNEVGAAITIMPVAIAVLDSWGYNFEQARGVVCQRMTLLHAGSLENLFHDEWPDLKSQYGHEALTYHRVDLHHGLVDLAVEPDSEKHDKGTPVSIHKGSEVYSIDCEAGSLTMKSGARFHKDLFVIADGARSHLFSQFTGQPDPISRIGRSIYRILLDRSVVESDPASLRFLESSPNALAGFCCAVNPVDNAFMIAYPCRSGSILNVAVVHDTKKSPAGSTEAERSWQAPSNISEVLQTAHNFHPDLKSLLQLAEDNDIKVHHGMHRPSLHSFGRGKALIMGDAAHLMLPTHAAGASMAIESAGVLGVLMRHVNTTSSSFSPTPTPSSSGSPQRVVPSPLDDTSQARSPTSIASSTHDLIVNPTNGTNHLKPNLTSTLAPPTLVATNSDVAVLASTPNLPGTNPIPSSPMSSAIARNLTLFDSLRVPRCTAFQILSNGGFTAQARPEIVEQIRKHGFNGPLPGPMATPWDREFREWYFSYDAIKEAERAVADLSPR